MACLFFILLVFFLLCGYSLPCAMLWGTKPSQALGDEAVPACAPRKPNAQVTQAAQDTQRPTKKRRLDGDLEAVPEISSEDEFCVEGHNATTDTASTNTTLAAHNTPEDTTPTRVLTIFDLPDEILGIILEFYSDPCHSLTDFWRKDSLSRKAVKWRAVCRRFKKVYDEGGFLKRTGVWLLNPSQFTCFNRKTPAGSRPIELRFLEPSDCDGLTTLAGLEQCQALEILRPKMPEESIGYKRTCEAASLEKDATSMRESYSHSLHSVTRRVRLRA